MLPLLPEDGTVKCVDRLEDSSLGDCLHPDVSMQSPTSLSPPKYTGPSRDDPAGPPAHRETTTITPHTLWGRSTTICEGCLPSWRSAHQSLHAAFQASFYCPSECPNAIWTSSSNPELACCVHGRFYPPQCIPNGVTLDDIRRDPDYSSPLCREFLHPLANWNVGFMEALIVNLKLMLVVHYVGGFSLPSVPQRCTLLIPAAPQASLYGYPDAAIWDVRRPREFEAVAAES
jgi:hypothetical protein